MPGGIEDRANANDQLLISYPDVRAGLLSKWDAGHPEAEWLVEAGIYLRACWLAEVAELDGDPLDEERTKKLWDGFSAGDIADQRLKAEQALEDYVRRKRFDDIVRDWQGALARAGVDASMKVVAQTLHSLAGFIKLLLWCALAMVRGVFGLMGVMIFGWLLLTLDPDFRERIRQAAADVLRKTEAPAVASPDRPRTTPPGS